MTCQLILRVQNKNVADKLLKHWSSRSTLELLAPLLKYPARTENLLIYISTQSVLGPSAIEREVSKLPPANLQSLLHDKSRGFDCLAIAGFHQQRQWWGNCPNGLQGADMHKRHCVPFRAAPGGTAAPSVSLPSLCEGFHTSYSSAGFVLEPAGPAEGPPLSKQRDQGDRT